MLNQPIHFHIFLDDSNKSVYHKQLDIGNPVTAQVCNQIYESFLIQKRIRYETQLYYIAGPQNSLQIHDNFKLPLEDMKDNTVKLKVVNCRKKLETKFEKFKQYITGQLRELQKKIDNFIPRSSDNLTDEQQIDIAFMYSQPLVSKQYNKPLNHLPVDFRSQIKDITHDFKQRLNLKCMIAKIQSFKEQINRRKPIILHISCHGNRGGQLQFEENLGQVRYVSSTELQSSLKNLVWIPKLVFINSCHSEEIAKPFKKLSGCDAVITVQRQAEINEQAAKIFSKEFYSWIFWAHSIPEAFEKAKKKLQKEYSSTLCCCYAHESHLQGCLWLKQVQRSERGEIGAHNNYHIPKCGCQERYMNRHLKNCGWANKVLTAIKKGYCRQEQIAKNKGKEKGELLKICCGCCEHKKQQENYRIYYRKEYQNQPIFHSQKQRKQNPLPLNINKFLPKQTLYSKQDQQKLYEFLHKYSDQSPGFLFVKGSQKLRINKFTQKGLSYLQQRNQLDVLYEIDLQSIRHLDQFKLQLKRLTCFNLSSEEDPLLNSYVILNKRFRKSLFLKNCQKLLKQNQKQFLSLLNQLADHTKVVVTVSKPLKMEYYDTLQHFHHYRGEIIVQNLTSKTAAQYLYRELPKANKEVTIEGLEKLINEYKFLTELRYLTELVQQFKHSSSVIQMKSIKKYLQSITDANKNLKDLKKVVEENLNKLKQENQKGYEFLIFISLFSDGITSDQLNNFLVLIDQVNIPQRNIIPICKDWQRLIEVIANKFCVKKHLQMNQDGRFKTNETIVWDFSGKENNKIKENFFLDSKKENQVMVKSEIQSIIWNQNSNLKVQEYKYIFAIYISISIQLALSRCRQRRLTQENIFGYSGYSQTGIFNPKLKQFDQNIRKQFQCMVKNMSEKNIDWNQRIHRDELNFFRRYEKDINKIYDLQFNFQKFLQKETFKGKYLFFWCLENLMVQIPIVIKLLYPKDYQTTLKQFANQNQRIRQKELSRINSYSGQYLLVQPICLLINQIRLEFIKIEYLLKDCRKQKKERQFQNCKSLIEQQIDDFEKTLTQNDKIKYSKKERKAIKSLKEACQWEFTVCRLYLIWKQGKNWEEFNKALKFFHEKYTKAKSHYFIQAPDPLITGKAALLLSINYLQAQHCETESKTITQYCKLAQHVFRTMNLSSLGFYAKVIEIRINMNCLTKRRQQERKLNDEFQQWVKLVKQCSLAFICKNSQLKKMQQNQYFGRKLEQMKAINWKKLNDGIIFLSSFPLCTYVKNQPIIKNLIHNNNNIIKQQIMSQIKQNLNIGFSILTKQKLDHALKNMNKIMIIYCDFQNEEENNGSLMLVEGTQMKQQPVLINPQFIKKIQKESSKTRIIIIMGQNVKRPFKIVEDTHKKDSSSKQRPFYIMIDLCKTKKFQIDQSSGQKYQHYQSLINENDELRIGVQNYINKFLGMLCQKKIDETRVREIHQAAEKVAIEKLKNKALLSFYIEKDNPIQPFYFSRGDYLDFSPHHFVSTNFDFIQTKLVWRHWQKLIQFFKYIDSITTSFYVNVHSVSKVKTSFVMELVRMMIDRQKFKYGGIYILEGKDIQKNKNSIEKYLIQQNMKILTQSSKYDSQLARLPTYHQFVEETASLDNTLIILDDYDHVANHELQRSESEDEEEGSIRSLNHNFIEKLIQRKANIIFVSEYAINPIKKMAITYKQQVSIKSILIKEPDQKYLDYFASNFLKPSGETLNQFRKISIKSLQEISQAYQPTK